MAAGVPGPYSGVSTLAFVARASALAFGVVYGSMKLSYLKSKTKSHKKAEANAHH
ncbi:ATP synthase F0 complex subunit E mitochondrial protein [Dioscorea alata]|uniref:ATP synthase F0 complex subunit E mitochondrial protein n=1 Tax=Dioscorea alata TaxID=55571 RepID=A0ACB7V6G8_DIOAL|nr:ATP synthase F0 complex subunit E mitochondrial protein [Dioscorea alata]